MTSQPKKTVRTSVILSEEIYLRVQTLAGSSDVSTVWVIRHAIQQFLDSHDQQTELPLRLQTARRVEGRR